MAGIADNAMRVSVLASTEPRDEAMTTRQSPQDGLNNQHKHYIRMLGELTAKLRAGIFMNIVGFYNAHFSLFESEDETIRKKIIQALKNFNNTQISGLPEPTIDEPFTALLKRVDSALLSDDDRAKLRNLDASWTLDRITQEISIIETQINRLSLSISKAAADYKLVENVQRQELALRALNIDLLLLKQAKSALRALTVIVSDNNPMLRNNIWNAIKQVFSIGDLVIQSAQTSIREYLQNDINLASLLGQLGYFENGFVEVLSRSVDQSLEYGISFDKVLVVLKDWYESKDPQRNEELVINISIILEDRYQEADLKKSSEQVSRVFINKLGINVGDIIQSQLADAAMAEDKLLFPLTDPLVMKRVLSSAIGRKVDLKVMSEGIVFRGDAVVVKKFDTRKGTVTVTVPAIEQDQVYATDGNNNPRSLPLLMSVNDIYASQKLADVYTSTRQFDQLQPGQKVLIVTGQAIDIINGSYEGEFVRYDKALDDRSKGIIFIDVLGVEKEIRLNTFNYADVRKGPGKPLKLKPNAAMTSSFVELSPEMLAKARELNAIFFQGASYDYEVLRERVEVLWRELNNAKSDKGSQIKKDVLSMPFAEKEMIVMRETLTYFQNVLDQNKVNSFSFHVSSYGWSVKNSQRELFALFIKNIFHLDSSSVSNSAMTGKANGGIDLKTSQMTWDIEREGSGFGIEISAGGGSAFSGDQAQMARYLKEGIKSLTPRIIGVERISNLWAIFGMKG